MLPRNVFPALFNRPLIIIDIGSTRVFPGAIFLPEIGRVRFFIVRVFHVKHSHPLLVSIRNHVLVIRCFAGRLRRRSKCFT